MADGLLTMDERAVTDPMMRGTTLAALEKRGLVKASVGMNSASVFWVLTAPGWNARETILVARGLKTTAEPVTRCGCTLGTCQHGEPYGCPMIGGSTGPCDDCDAQQRHAARKGAPVKVDFPELAELLTLDAPVKASRKRKAVPTVTIANSRVHVKAVPCGRVYDDETISGVDTDAPADCIACLSQPQELIARDGTVIRVGSKVAVAGEGTLSGQMTTGTVESLAEYYEGEWITTVSVRHDDNGKVYGHSRLNLSCVSTPKLFADDAASAHYASATAEPYSESAYEASKEALRSAIVTAYPDVDVDAVYGEWLDHQESIAYCVARVAENAAYEAKLAIVSKCYFTAPDSLRSEACHLCDYPATDHVLYAEDGVSLPVWEAAHGVPAPKLDLGGRDADDLLYIPSTMTVRYTGTRDHEGDFQTSCDACDWVSPYEWLAEYAACEEARAHDCAATVLVTAILADAPVTTALLHSTLPRVTADELAGWRGDAETIIEDLLTGVPRKLGNGRRKASKAARRQHHGRR